MELSEKQFIHNESYMHLKAKEVLCEWLNDGIPDDYRGIGEFTYRSCREKGAFAEYPIVKVDETSSWNISIDELVTPDDDDEYSVIVPGYIPTYSQCVNIHKIYPVAIVDIVCIHKGTPIFGFEVCHKHPVPSEKVDKLVKFGVTDIYEVSAEWILNQTSKPAEIKYIRQVC